MSKRSSVKKSILKDLRDGLILRRATPEDAEALVAFNALVHKRPDAQDPDEGIEVWTRDLMKGDHPTIKLDDFTIVEDTNTGAIVSSSILISQTWSYGGIEVGVGRPELVGTHPDYRRRGLVRAQLEVIHEWSAKRGEKMQAITGIPWYYRQFGYEMAMTLRGGRVGYKPQIPSLKDDEEEAYRVRSATEADLPFIVRSYEEGSKRYLVSCVRDRASWHYELSGRSQKSGVRLELQVVENLEGKAVGFFAHQTGLWGNIFGVSLYELKPKVSWLAVTPTVIRYLQATGEDYAEPDKDEFEGFGFWLGIEHPVYDVIKSRLPHIQDPFAWFLRVADLPDFLKHVSPVLENRLEESALVGHTGELKISFYRSGLRLAFEDGRLNEIGLWEPTFVEPGDAAFPDLTFLQLLFSYRTLEELEYAFADCRANTDEARVLLNILFPKRLSNVWPVS